MRTRRAAKALTALALAGSVAAFGATDAFAASNWQKDWTSNGAKVQYTPAYHVGKGKHFLHLSIKGNGKTTFTAELYKKVKGKDPKIQSFTHKDKYVEWYANWKQMSAGDYYIALKYPKKGKKVHGGVQ
jgi:hypothetical protein